MPTDIDAIYREIADHIQKHPKEIAFSRGVPAELVQRAESALALRFPPSFQRYLLEYGGGGIGGEGVNGLAGTAALGLDFAEAYGVEDIVYETLNDRKIYGIPNAWIPLIDNEGDEIFYLDTSVADERGENPVIRWGIEDREHPVRYADSFAEFLLKRMKFRFG
jgi:cell wall assembly regulator SMI1